MNQRTFYTQTVPKPYITVPKLRNALEVHGYILFFYTVVGKPKTY